MADPDSIPIRLRAAPGLPRRLRAADGVELAVPPGLGRKGLTELLNTLLASSDEAAAAPGSPRPPPTAARRHDFDITVLTTGELLRTTLLKFLRRRQLGTEKTVDLRYGLPSPPPVAEGAVATAGDGVTGAHGAPITGVAWLPAPSADDAATRGAFVTAGADETVRLWSAAAAAPPAGAAVGDAAAAAGAPPVLRGVFRSDDVATAATPFACVATAPAGEAGGPPVVAAGGTNGDVWVVATAAARLDDPPTDSDGEGGDDGGGGAAAAAAGAGTGAGAGAGAGGGGRGRKRRAAAAAGAPALGGRRLDGGPRQLPISAVAFGGADELAAAAWDGTVRLWAVDAGVVRVTLPAGGKALTALAPAPPPPASSSSSTAAAPPITVMAVTGVDGAVRLLDARVGGGAAVVVGASPPRRGHAGIASAVAWTGAAAVVTGGHDGGVAAWDTRSLAAPTTRLADAAGVGEKVLALAVGGGGGGGGEGKRGGGGGGAPPLRGRLGRAGVELPPWGGGGGGGGEEDGPALL
ncbi:hypothetical protein I4F81_006290 [Pyropia yezoensis]|uniref:Uncharacterized protein n=1 Tax=Pyropia yezoensis TaxID=2788 RepID=A0ACC3C1W0_PYRYE|nr:hypothetical protein I4F81_006290 [Neopyropia yezoensis]